MQSASRITEKINQAYTILKSKKIKQLLNPKNLVSKIISFLLHIGSKRNSIKKNTKVQKSRKEKLHLDIDSAEKQ